MLMNENDLYDNNAVNNIYQNNQSLHNDVNKMLSFADSDPGIKTVNSPISFIIIAKNPDGTACSDCTAITTFPSELVSKSDNNGVVTGSFTPSKSGTYSVTVAVTDSGSNITKRNYSFFCRYYYY
jgi:hypothetical protein